jgi:hypothetical protein
MLQGFTNYMVKVTAFCTIAKMIFACIVIGFNGPVE